MSLTTGKLLQNFGIRNASEFVSYVQSEESSLYAFIGKITPWANEPTPDPVYNTVQQEIDIWNDIIGMKRISGNDVIQAFQRIDWIANTTYDEYDYSIDLTDKQFYVVTDDNNVYKCINNNNGGRSTVKPTHTTFDGISYESDGYRWKFMFAISDSLLDKYIVPNYLPIDVNLSVVNAAVPGTVDNIKIVSAGSGYTANASVDSGTEIPVFIQGDGNSNDSATVQISTVGGRIGNLVLSGGGSNYPTPNQTRIPVAIRQLTATGVVQNAYGIASTNVNGEIESVSLVNAGSGYQNGNASIVSSSCRAYAETNSNGQIINADVFTGREGENFRIATAVIVSATGTGAELSPLLSPIDGHGSDPAAELLSSYAMINLRLSDAESSFLATDDFRRIGLIEDPIAWDSNYDEVVTATAVDAKWEITLSNPVAETFTSGETILGFSSRAQGLETSILDSSTLRVTIDRSISSDLEFAVGETIKGLSSASEAAIESINPPAVKPYTGKVLYISNRELVERTADLQIETITLVIDY